MDMLMQKGITNESGKRIQQDTGGCRGSNEIEEKRKRQERLGNYHHI